METSDAVLVEQARAGDTEAFGALVQRHSRHVFRLAFRMTGNEQDAEDVVQEALLRAYRQLKNFDRRSSFGTWLYRIAANCSLDVVRLRKRRNERQSPASEENEAAALEIPAADPTPDRLAMSNEVKQRLAEAMDELSPMERAAFVLRHFEGMRIEELSQLMGVQAGAAKHSIFRAVQKLRRVLEPLASSTK